MDKRFVLMSSSKFANERPQVCALKKRNLLKHGLRVLTRRKTSLSADRSSAIVGTFSVKLKLFEVWILGDGTAIAVPQYH
jgi:hypothetical protein